jgi:hypothetical protein
MNTSAEVVNNNPNVTLKSAAGEYLTFILGHRVRVFLTFTKGHRVKK